MLVARDNRTHFLNALRLITVPDAKSDSAESAPATPTAAARDAVLQRDGARHAEDRAALSGRPDWVHEFAQGRTARRSSEKSSSVEEAVDRLLATWWPAT